MTSPDPRPGVAGWLLEATLAAALLLAVAAQRRWHGGLQLELLLLGLLLAPGHALRLLALAGRLPAPGWPGAALELASLGLAAGTAGPGSGWSLAVGAAAAGLHLRRVAWSAPAPLASRASAAAVGLAAVALVAAVAAQRPLATLHLALLGAAAAAPAGDAGGALRRAGLALVLAVVPWGRYPGAAPTLLGAVACAWLAAATLAGPAAPARPAAQAAAFAAACAAAYSVASGPVALLALGGLLGSLPALLRQAARARGWPVAARRSARAALACGAVAVALAAAEGAMGLRALLRERAAATAPTTATAAAPASATTPQVGGSTGIPAEWARTAVEVPGAAVAYRWHGHLHVHDSHGFRTTAPVVRLEGPPRVVALGDSLTYGYGVAAEEAWPARLEALLAARGAPARVYNLGVSGYQSEDIARLAGEWLPRLAPAVVVYGVCLNDLLESGVGEQDAATAWAPVHPVLAAPIAERTRLGGVVARGFDQLLLRAGLRNDFYDDVLARIDVRLPRFERDVRRLVAACEAAGAGRLVVLVLDQYPSQAKATSLVRRAEEAAAAAGADVIPTAAWRREHAAKAPLGYAVSPWEGHPNAACQAMFAALIAERLAADPRLARPR